MPTHTELIVASRWLLDAMDACLATSDQRPAGDDTQPDAEPKAEETHQEGAAGGAGR